MREAGFGLKMTRSPLTMTGPLQDAALAQADEAASLAEDDVVEKLDAEELAGGGQAPRQRDVLARWFRVAARVRVRGEDCRAPGQDGGLEHFAGMDERARQAADGDR